MNDPPLLEVGPLPTPARGKEAAAEFAAFVRARTHALLRTAFLLTGDQHLAEDLVQAALMRTHRAWGRLAHRGHAEAYTRRAMYHLQVSWWRRGRVSESLSEVVPEPRSAGAADGPAQVETRLVLLTALRRLTPAQRAVLVLRYFDDHSEAQTADVLGVAIGTVKSQTSKALARLRMAAPELADHYFGTEER